MTLGDFEGTAKGGCWWTDAGYEQEGLENHPRLFA